MANDKISIIVPVYNLENYIEKTLDSICAQTYKNLEVIVVNDGSKDNSLDVLYNYAKKDERVKVINKENGGVTKARMTGVKAATGEWIGFVDGDDLLDSDMYECLLGNAKKYNAQISHCGYKMVFPSRIDYYHNTGKLVKQDNKTGVENLLEGQFVEPGLCNKLYKKELLDKLLNDDKIDYSIKITEDLMINYYLFKSSEKSVFYDKCFYHYILRKGSAATSVINENKLKDPIKVLKLIKGDLKDNDELKNIVDRRIIARLTSVVALDSKINKALIKPYKKTVHKEIKEYLPQVMKGDYSRKLKLMTLWCAVWPWSYMVVHRVYGCISGVDKKFEVK